MQALGLIETKGLLAAIEAADTMVKSADVSIIEKTYVGGGLVTIAITGDVGAVKAAVDSGVAAVNKLDQQALVSEHVIPRPHEELESIIGPNTPEVLEVTSSVDETDDIDDISEAEDVEDTQKIDETEDKGKENQNKNTLDLDKLHKNDLDDLVSKNGIEKTISILSKLKVVKLRNLAREYKDFVITGRAISKAGKNLLITKFRLYYEKN